MGKRNVQFGNRSTKWIRRLREIVNEWKGDWILMVLYKNLSLMIVG